MATTKEKALALLGGNAALLLKEAKTITEVLKIRNAARMGEQYFKAAHYARSAFLYAAEIRLRAERKAGEMLKEMAEKGERAGRGGDRAKSHDVTLPGLDITKMQSSRWQQIAAVPEEIFESYIVEGKESESSELTTAGLRTIVKLQHKADLAEQIQSEAAQFPEGPFRVLVIDPPWKYDARSEDPTHRALNPYPDMTIDEIKGKIPVPEMAHEDCILWLWTTNAFLRQAFECLDEWGFECKTVLTWIKDRMGTGDWLRGQTEHCLMAVRGKPIVTLTNQTTALCAPMRQHSRKPDEFYQLVESLCPGNRCELYGRQIRDGWTAFGAEKDHFRST